MNCRKVSHLLSAYMDSELPGVEHRQIHEHLARCGECQLEYRTLLKTKRLISALRVQEPSEQLPAAILERLRAERDLPKPRALTRLTELRQAAMTRLLMDISPSPRGFALGAGLALAGILFVSHTLDASDRVQTGGALQWTPISAQEIATAQRLQPASALNSVPPLDPAPSVVEVADRWLRAQQPSISLTPVANETGFSPPQAGYQADAIQWTISH